MSIGALKRLARAWGVQEAYYDVAGCRQKASPEALLGVLQAIGAPVARIADAADALRTHQQQAARTMIEPVVPAWNGLALDVRVSAADESRRYEARLVQEDGRSHRITGRCKDWPTVDAYDVEGVRGTVRRFEWPIELRHGYHRLEIGIGHQRTGSLVLSAPGRVFNPLTGKDRRTWGVFLPLYALHSQRSWGTGDLTDLENLTTWTRRLGGRITATLPLMAGFWYQSDDYSPYSPASRLFWNEFYLDITRCVGFEECRPVQKIVRSPAFQRELAKAHRGRLVDYARIVRLKRKLLEQLANHLFTGTGHQRGELGRFLKKRPETDRYAQFRAVCERRGLPWMEWPARLRDGTLHAGDYGTSAWRYHLYVQWQIDAQLKHLAQRAGSNDVLWYLDLPLGVNRAGYDTWQAREAFALDVDGGAPPDAFFSKGQNWGFPPMHPVGIRRQHYRYVIAMLRRQLTYAKMLRIDHVAGLHRLFCIPQGRPATDGAYVRYRAEELYAILAIESHRAGAGIVGENLGTVPHYVNRALSRHGVRSMYILPFEVRPDRRPPVNRPSRGTLAALNTHDMPTFTAYWKGTDIDRRIRLGLLPARSRSRQHRDRAKLRRVVRAFLLREALPAAKGTTTAHTLEACLQWLASSRADIVLVNLEDLWLETEPQNVPGTCQEHPNWRGRAAARLEDFQRDPRVLRLLEAVEAARRT